jgi:hypothetical protein
VSDFQKPADYLLKRVWFWFKGGLYRGRGLMNWKPEAGFCIQAFLDRKEPSVARAWPLGVSRVADRRDACVVRMSFQYCGRAFIPNVFLLGEESQLNRGHLSLKTDRVIFYTPQPVLSESKCWSGSALFKVGVKLQFPDSVVRKTSISNHWVQSYHNGGIWHEDDRGLSVRGQYDGDGLFKLSWDMAKTCWSKAECWRWGRAAQQALSILFGQTVQLHKREVDRGARQITEVRQQEPVETLWHALLPIPPVTSREESLLMKSTFLRLTEFFARDRPNAETCWMIFYQIAEANRQKSWQAQELLLATILEAALRTVDQHPFNPGDWSWKVRESMPRFRQNYLSPEWQKACEMALVIWKRLRHRNAHPDWLATEGGAFSKQKMKASMQDMSFLSRFYGYMILALAGFKDLKPLFPQLQIQDD